MTLPALPTATSAQAFFQLEDDLRAEAAALRERATQLMREADRMSAIGAAVTDGRDILEAQRITLRP